MSDRVGARPERQRIVYAVGRLDLAFVIFGLLMLAAGVAPLLATVAVRLGCERGPADGAATCSVTRYGADGVEQDRFRAGDVRQFEITGASTVAGMRLEVRDSRDGPRGVTLVSGTSREKFVSRAEAEQTKQAFEAFVADGAARELTLWFRPGLGYLVLTVVALLVGWLFGIAQIRAAFARRARIAIDVGVEGLGFAGNALAADEVEDVVVEAGEMPSASETSGVTVGHRLVVTTRDGRHLPIGEDFRARPRDEHEAVRLRILAALGRS